MTNKSVILNGTIFPRTEVTVALIPKIAKKIKADESLKKLQPENSD